MAHLQRSHLVRLALLAAATNAQFPGMPGGPPADARPIFKTGKYLGCTVCKLAVEEIWKEALRLREEAPYKKPSEDMYQDSIQQICDPIKDLGEWVAMYDITQSERGAPLRMEKQEYMCECRRECCREEEEAPCAPARPPLRSPPRPPFSSPCDSPPDDSEACAARWDRRSAAFLSTEPLRSMRRNVATLPVPPHRLFGMQREAKRAVASGSESSNEQPPARPNAQW